MYSINIFSKQTYLINEKGYEQLNVCFKVKGEVRRLYQGYYEINIYYSLLIHSTFHNEFYLSFSYPC